MSMKKIFALLLALVMTMSLAACGGQAEEPTEPVTDPQVDSLDRVVVFNSSLCTVLEAFGKADAIVGAYGSLAETYGVPSCGKWNEVDVEAVIATDAQAVFGYEKYTTAEQISKLSDAGINCYFIELSNADTAAAEVAQLAIQADIAFGEGHDAGPIVLDHLDAVEDGLQGFPVVFPVDHVALELM